MNKLAEGIKLLTDSGKELGRNQPLILASSTAFFTTFSIPPILIIFVNILSLYFRKERVTQAFSESMTRIFDQRVADQMSRIADNFSAMASQPWITVGGSIFLVLVATNLFKIVRMSINQIWNIRVVKTVHLPTSIRSRVIALGLIFLTGIFFVLSTLSDSLIAVMENMTSGDFMGLNTIFILVASKIVAVLFIGLWFAALFRFLPDGKVHWKAILTGSFVTSVLFMIGKYLLERFLINSNISNIFETSTSVVLIMLFIFYSSIIMYYGAGFTYIYAQYIGKSIEPRKNAERYETKVVRG